jgi:hypothetical protein
MSFEPVARRLGVIRDTGPETGRSHRPPGITP